MSPLSRSSQPANRAASVKPEPAAEPASDDEESALQTLATDSPAGDTPASGPHGHRAESFSETPSVPLQKRRRVTRACEYVTLEFIPLFSSLPEYTFYVDHPELFRVLKLGI